MHPAFAIFTLLLTYSNGQMRPPNWDLDIMRFDQRDWDRFGQDFGQNGRRPFPSFRPSQIPTQEPPIVGQIPGGQVGQGSKRGGNGNEPPPLPPMPRVPGSMPTDVPAPSQPSPNANGQSDDENKPPVLARPGMESEEPSPGKPPEGDSIPGSDWQFGGDDPNLFPPSTQPRPNVGTEGAPGPPQPLPDPMSGNATLSQNGESGNDSQSPASQEPEVSSPDLTTGGQNDDRPSVLPPSPEVGPELLPLPSPDTPPDMSEGEEPQSQVPPPVQPPDNPNQAGDGKEMNSGETVDPNRSETSTVMAHTTQNSDEREIGTSPQPTVDLESGKGDSPGFTFSPGMEQVPRQLGEEGTSVPEQFGFSAGRDPFPTPQSISPSDELFPSDQDQGTVSRADQIPEESEHRDVINQPSTMLGQNPGQDPVLPKGKRFNIPSESAPTSFGVGSRRWDSEVSSTPETVLRSTPQQGMEERGDLERLKQRMGSKSIARLPRGG